MRKYCHLLKGGTHERLVIVRFDVNRPTNAVIMLVLRVRRRYQIARLKVV
jgi:hypothetical protein